MYFLKAKIDGHPPANSGILRKQQMSSLSTLVTKDCSSFREHIQIDALRERPEAYAGLVSTAAACWDF